MKTIGILLAAVVLSAALAGCTVGKGSKGPGTPIADMKITPKAGDPQVFTFDATNSSDPDGQALTVRWTFGDDGKLYNGSMAENGKIEYTYVVPNAVYHVGLVVEDPEGNRAAIERSVSVGTGENQAPHILVGNSSRWVRPGTEITIDSSRSADADDDLFTTEWIVGNHTSSPPPEAILSTPLLGRGESANQTFNALGYYDYHCHPHPWMRGRIIVSDASPGAVAGTATVDILAFSFQPRVLVVQPGTTVRFTNGDPVPHNVTMSHFSPGRLQGETTSSAVLAVRPEAGDYVANLILDDLKGGYAWQSFGLRVDSGGPQKFLVTYANRSDVNTGTTAAVGPDQHTVNYRADWPQNLSGVVSWTDPGGMSSWTIGLYRKTSGVKLASCVVEETTCGFAINVEPGDYEARLLGAGTGVRVKVDVILSALQYSKPPFGDASSAGHQH